MLTDLFEAKAVEPKKPDVTESEIWMLLGMDKLGEKMVEDGISSQNPIFMGTGYTHNACYMCSNTVTRSCFPQEPTC